MNLLERLTTSAHFFESPYKHIIFENLLRPEDVKVIQDLVASIPKQYITSSNPGYEDYFEHEEIYCLNTYRYKESSPLSLYLNQLAAPEVLRWLLEKLDLKIELEQCQISLVLHREFAEFKGLEPHTDLLNSNNKKILNFFFYLSNPEDCPSHYGTKLLQGDTEEWTMEAAKLISYKANQALAFAINETSWHMVDALEKDCQRRDVLVMRLNL